MRHDYAVDLALAETAGPSGDGRLVVQPLACMERVTANRLP